MRERRAACEYCVRGHWVAMRGEATWAGDDGIDLALRFSSAGAILGRAECVWSRRVGLLGEAALGSDARCLRLALGSRRDLISRPKKTSTTLMDMRRVYIYSNSQNIHNPRSSMTVE